jgi:hypothetical protein
MQCHGPLIDDGTLFKGKCFGDLMQDLYRTSGIFSERSGSCMTIELVCWISCPCDFAEVVTPTATHDALATTAMVFSDHTVTNIEAFNALSKSYDRTSPFMALDEW